MKHRFILFGFVLILMGGLLMGCCMHAKVRVKCSTDDEGRLIVDVNPNWRVNGLYRAVFWLQGDDKYLWALKEDTESMRRIIYGEVPLGLIQTYPPHGTRPRDIPDGSILYVSVDYQYDTPFPPAACIDTHCVKFQISEDGIKYLGEALGNEGLQHPVPGGKLIFGPGYGGPDFVDPLLESADENP